MVRNGTEAVGYHIPRDLSASAVLFFYGFKETWSQFELKNSIYFLFCCFFSFVNCIYNFVHLLK